MLSKMGPIYFLQESKRTLAAALRLAKSISRHSSSTAAHAFLIAWVSKNDSDRSAGSGSIFFVNSNHRYSTLS